MTPEERREAFIQQAVWQSESHSQIEIEEIRRRAVNTWTWITNYFDEHEPAVADAIRFGLKEQQVDVSYFPTLPEHTTAETFIYINYPEGHPKR